MSDMPIGLCSECQELLDFKDAGFCEYCKSPFCWISCGGWHKGEHACNECQESLKEDRDE